MNVGVLLSAFKLFSVPLVWFRVSCIRREISRLDCTFGFRLLSTNHSQWRVPGSPYRYGRMPRQIFSESDLKALKILCRDGIVEERFTLDKNHYLETWTEVEWRRMLVECHSLPVFYDHKKFFCSKCRVIAKKMMQKHRLNNHKGLDHVGLKFYSTALEQNWPSRLSGRVTGRELIQEWLILQPDN